MKERSSFSGRVGFVLAAAGSAVGLGNIWRFPYLAAKYGGGIFLLVYLVLVLTFGHSIMTMEIAIGRKTKLSAIAAYRSLHKGAGFLGVLASLVPIIILPYYCVIGGWVFKYLFSYLTGQQAAMAQDSFFPNFISSAHPIVWLSLFVIVTFLVVMMGVKNGIEKANKLMMPLLVLLTIAVAVYSVTLPGAWEGFLYYITPNFKNFSVTTILAAMGQMFYSMSLAMGIMITYGSYLKKEDDIEKSVHQISFFDTGIAFLAGAMVVPAVFAFSGGDQSKLNAGAGLMFQTLPKVFEAMGMARVIGIVFFLLVLFAALTSSISLMETVISFVEDRLHWHRKPACCLVGAYALVFAIPSALGYGPLSGVAPLGMSLLDFFDFISNSVLMPVVALLSCLLVGYVLKPKVIIDEVTLSSRFRSQRLFTAVIRYIAPVLIVFILITSVLSAMGILLI